MAYINTENSSRRVVTLGAVVAVHVVAIYAVVNGLTVAFTPFVDPPPISATNQPLPVPSPTKPPPHPRIIKPVDQTARPLDPIPQFTITPTLPEWNTDPHPLPTGPIALPSPRLPMPTATPKAARPIGNPGGWVSSDDYPTRELREGHAGTVGFRLALGANGRVASCTITRSSGFPGLDEATCRLLTARGRFDPATDDSGAAATGSYSNVVRWQIPD